ncbi:hypothetical protein DAPPUDRAFT_346425 [Daphnia pulex]|uniref:Uncharacterized protein n=1 Tax=Daphnia pulex TaxID=6669 RepID=E9I7W5_DAPPU|nr:hypothetical protein DAPPUDRAFT_346425 [Daphnia pulex]|eukprot:EFX59915.1 hypothetical protein DAPPUDRAFT_346425 [Daphnia pulex]
MIGDCGNKESSTLENVVKNSVSSSLKVDNSSSAAQNTTQTGKITGVRGSTVKDVSQTQTSKLKLSSINVVQSSNNFKSALESKLKEKITQKTETGSMAANTSETVQKNINEFSFNATKALTNSLTVVSNAKQDLEISDVTDKALVEGIKQIQTVEALAEMVTNTILADEGVANSKAELEKVLDQKAEGWAGMFSSMTAPLIAIAVIILLVLVFKFMK